MFVGVPAAAQGFGDLDIGDVPVREAALVHGPVVHGDDVARGQGAAGISHHAGAVVFRRNDVAVFIDFQVEQADELDALHLVR